MLGFFESSGFKYLVFPLLCALGTVVFRSITREDKASSFRSEDWMIGPDLIWQSITILAAGISDKVAQHRASVSQVRLLERELGEELYSKVSQQLGLSQKAEALISLLSTSGFVMFSYILVAVGVSVFVRQFGWEGPSKPFKMTGIVLPLFLGLMMLAVAMRFLTIG